MTWWNLDYALAIRIDSVWLGPWIPIYNYGIKRKAESFAGSLATGREAYSRDPIAMSINH